MCSKNYDELQTSTSTEAAYVFLNCPIIHMTLFLLDFEFAYKECYLLWVSGSVVS
jgi:hypothetical protein